MKLTKTIQATYLKIMISRLGLSRDEQTVDMVGNYWSNVVRGYSLVFDYDDRFDLKGEVDFANKLDKPSSDAPITPQEMLSSQRILEVPVQMDSNEKRSSWL